MEDSSQDTVPCPVCGRSIWAHAEQCPGCGEWFAGEAWQASRGRRGRTWQIVAIVLVIVMVLLVLSGWW